LVAFALVHFVGDVADPANIKRVSRVAMCSTLVASALTAALSAGFQTLFDGAAFGELFATWLASHTLGMVIFATLTVVARVQGLRVLGRNGHRLDLAVSALLVAVSSWVVFTQTHYPLLFMVYPPLLLIAFRHRFSGVVCGMALVTVIAIGKTLAGHGPLYLIPHAGPTERILLLQLFIATSCLLSIPVAVVLTDRGFLARRLAESERRYRILADYSRDLVVRIAADGRRLYVSPSAKDMLGWELSEFSGPRMDLIHPDDVATLEQAIRDLHKQGGASTVTYRTRHKDGHYVWIEANARRVPGPEGGLPEIIYAGRDVTRRTEVEQALVQNQRRLRAITDNIPALVVHVNTELLYTFANAKAGTVLGLDPAQIVGKHMRDVLSPAYFAKILPYAEAALRGEESHFESERQIGDNTFYYQTAMVPDFETDGTVSGLYGMSSDITQLKHTESELKLLARFDSLTGLANRFHFNERAELALARHRRNARPLALLYLDIDRFKQINDTLGHAVGDGVLQEFARRLSNCLRETDFAARLGGDEFVVLVEDADSAETPQIIARKMIAALQLPIDVAGRELRATTSIGIAYCAGATPEMEALLLAADKALYAAKADGREIYRIETLG
ncbi:MAG TPA: diguanylate cyclase, partial [Xanthomonadaceae bacterium]|nr:diguanylate cyclase [Xanthomonadaceae bacterium]